MFKRFNALVLLVITAGTIGCSSGGPRALPAHTMPPLTPIDTIFVADGAGNYQEASKAVRRTVELDNMPFHVVTHEWSHGYRRVLADHTCTDYKRHQAKLLADKIMAFLKKYPDRRAYLVGHCSGSFVALATAEALPPQTVERIILLAPSVSSHYDLKPALRASKEGLDVFYSKRDWFHLGCLVNIIGCADRRWGKCAGRNGFKPTDPAVKAMVRQHPWSEAVEWTGHEGGHFGAYHPDYMRTYVLSGLQSGDEPDLAHPLPMIKAVSLPDEE